MLRSRIGYTSVRNCSPRYIYTLIESDNENVWDMSVEEKGTQQNKDAVQKEKYQLNAIFDNGTC
ncbi:hypothetical protein LRC96_004279 [Salmonella enterica]|nr:hypothetical protein [Salmonella enterica]